MSSFADRIKQRMSELNITRQKDLADKAGMSTAQLSYVLSGSRGLGVDALLDLATALDCDPYWLHRGKAIAGSNIEVPATPKSESVPVLTEEMLPIWLNGTYTGTATIPSPKPVNPRSFAFRAIGEAMSPFFSSGDILFLDGSKTSPNAGAYALVYIGGDFAVPPLLRHIQQIDNRLFYAALNNSLPSEMKYIPHSTDDLIVGHVIGVFKDI